MKMEFVVHIVVIYIHKDIKKSMKTTKQNISAMHFILNTVSFEAEQMNVTRT
jgi:hypothetical protein